MANIVSITIKANSDTASTWEKVKADAAKAGAAAADEFNKAFKLKADASVTTRDKLQDSGSGPRGGTVTTRDKLDTTGGISGDDKSLLNRLKGYASTPGGIGILGTGNDTSIMSMLKNQIRSAGQNGGLGLIGTGSNGGGMSTQDIIDRVITGATPGNVSTKDIISQVMQGNTPGDVTTKDLIDQVLQGTGASNVSTKDFIQQVITGKQPGNIDTKDIIHPDVDDADIKDAGKKDADNYSSSFAGELKSRLDRLLGGGGGSGLGIGKLLTGGGGEGEGNDESAISGALNSGGVVGGALPGITGVSGMAATVTGLAGALVAVLPAITSVVAGLGAIGGGFMILEATNKNFAADMKSTLSGIEADFTKAAAPLAKPLEQAASEIGGYFKRLEPVFQAIFGDSGQLVQPPVKAFEGFTSGVLPGFLSLIKSGAPVFSVFAGSMTNLGKDLGDMFSDFAQAGPGSASILKSLMDVVGSLLPFIGTLAKTIVTSVAPAFAAFSGAITQVLPALTPLMSIIGQFAGAVLTDLAGVLAPIGTLLVDLAPSFTTLAKAAGQVFSALENDGVFATLATILGNLAGPLANLINALVKGLAPAIPGIVSFVGQLATVFANLASAGLTVIINAFTKLVQIITPFLPAIVDIIAGLKGLSIAFGILDAVMDLNPFVLVAGGITLLAGAMYEAWEKSSTFRDVLQDIGSAMVGVGIIIIEGARDITGAFLNMVGDVIQGAADAFGWIPGIGGKLQSAATAFDGMKSHVNDAFNSMISTMQGWQSDLTGANHTVSTVTNQMNNDFSSQASAAKTAGSALSNYTDVIKENGVSSDAAKAARQQLITDMEKSGVNAGVAKVDVDNYTTAVKDNGTTSSQAQTAREKLISDILGASNNAKQGQTDLANYTNIVKDNGSASQAAENARAQLIKDLENAGISAKNATTLVDNLTSAIKKVPGSVSTSIHVSISGSGEVTATQQVPGVTTAKGSLTFADLLDVPGSAKGGLLPGFGGGDQILRLLEPGEAVVDKFRTKKYASLLAMMGVPGMSSGGFIDFGEPASWAAGKDAGFGSTMGQYFATQSIKALNAAVKAVSVANQANPSAGPGGGDPAANYALAQALYPMYKGTDVMSAWNNVAMRESGWNQFAMNPTSGAYGIAQALPFTKMPKAAWPASAGGSSNPTAQIEWMWDYMAQSYGGPIGAWDHEVNYGWYDKGGWLQPGYTMAYNGTGKPEPVGTAGNAQIIQLEVTASGNSAFEQFMIMSIRNWVRINAGGNVQKALGRS